MPLKQNHFMLHFIIAKLDGFGSLFPDEQLQPHRPAAEHGLSALPGSLHHTAKIDYMKISKNWPEIGLCDGEGSMTP